MKALSCSLLAAIAIPLGAQTHSYPPIDRYLMPRDAEIALARTAAPASISSHATIKVLTASRSQDQAPMSCGKRAACAR